MSIFNNFFVLFLVFNSFFVFFFQPSGSWVTVHNLKQLDGGILDPDDRLHDVADDREQILAIYDEQQPHNKGDGTSASDDSQDPEPSFGVSLLIQLLTISSK